MASMQGSLGSLFIHVLFVHRIRLEGRSFWNANGEKARCGVPPWALIS